MDFKHRLKQRRTELSMTQTELAQKTGVTLRTIQYYENGDRSPANIEIAQKLAVALDTNVEYLLGSGGKLVVMAHEQGGAKAAKDVDELVSEVQGLFAGGRLDDEAMDGVMEALFTAYMMAKKKNRKYTPKKYRKDKPEEPKA
ncbi:MAG: helix-turn-helix transcriptional regulator [Angelakisella sp.]|jgi:transcriptional regulator with XRE-family HTH domain|nr:helix-turn-helix transcriptional regulator [Angelakisella sp.]